MNDDGYTDGFSPYEPPAPRPAALTATRSLGIAAATGAVLLIGYGWLTFASFTPVDSGDAPTTVNGWGQVFFDGRQFDSYYGGEGSPYTGVFIPAFVIPVVILGLLVACNIGRFGNSVAIFALAILHLLLSLLFLAAPSMCLVFDTESGNEVFESVNTFSTGPGAILTTLTIAIVSGTSLAGIILGRRKTYPQPAAGGFYPGQP